MGDDDDRARGRILRETRIDGPPCWVVTLGSLRTLVLYRFCFSKIMPKWQSGIWQVPRNMRNFSRHESCCSVRQHADAGQAILVACSRC